MSDQAVTISGEQRDALYAELLALLSGIDDVWLAIERGDFERADRLAREFSNYLRLIFEGLGWGDHNPASVELTMPPDVLRQTLSRLREQATKRYEQERPEQEAFRAQWEYSALVRSTCDEILNQLPEK
jgi:hypothetical protein